MQQEEEGEEEEEEEEMADRCGTSDHQPPTDHLRPALQCENQTRAAGGLAAAAPAAAAWR